MSSYATGKYSVGFCRKCGLPYPYLDLVYDGEVPRLPVCRECQDPRHPQKDPKRATERMAVKKQSDEDPAPRENVVQFPLYDVMAGVYYGPFGRFSVGIPNGN